MSLRRNWDSPNPLPASECDLPPGPKGGGGHTRLRPRVLGNPNYDDWRKSLALCLLYGSNNTLGNISKAVDNTFLLSKSAYLQ